MTDHPSIVWLTLESVRADHTTLGGYHRNTTPNIQQLAKSERGTSFSNCFSHSIWTPAASASILTGTYMSQHGVGFDGTGERPVPDDLTTLPEMLRRGGYSTVCLSPNAYLSPALELDRGFDEFRWLNKKNILDAGLGPLGKYALTVRKNGPGFTLNPRKHNLTYIMAELAKKWIRAKAKEDNPFFLYAHLGNPHHPYAPPKGWRGEYTEEVALSTGEALDVSFDIFDSQESMKRTIATGCSLSTQQWDALHAMYDAEIRFADACVGRLVDHLRSVINNDVIVVVTADHGELFGEQGVLGHNLILHDAVTHVPAVVYGIEDLDHNANELVQHADLTRTVAEVAGQSSDQLQGVDIRKEKREYAVLQRGTAHFDPYLQHNSEFDVSRFHENPVTAIRTKSFKYQHSNDRTALYRLPDESAEVSEHFPHVCDHLSQTLEPHDEWEQAGTETAETEFTSEMEEQLSDLGYL